MKSTSIFRLTLILLLFTVSKSFAAPLFDTITIENHSVLIGKLVRIQRQTHDYRDLMRRWKSDPGTDFDKAATLYSDVASKMDGFIATYKSMINNGRPRRINISGFQADVEDLQLSLNKLIEFFGTHYEKHAVKPSFTFTLDFVKLLFDFVKSVWDFTDGRIRHHKDVLITELEKCKIESWDAVGSGATQKDTKTTDTKTTDTKNKQPADTLKTPRKGDN